MRLFLSSSGLSAAPDELSGLVRPHGRVAVSLNARDNLPGCDALRPVWLDEQAAALAALGFAVHELDFRDHDGEPAALLEALSGVDLVWVAGGNAFVLREAMRRSGFDDALADLLAQDSIAYSGYSAGACVAGPTLRGIDLVDDVDAVSVPVWAGLELVDFSVAPHYRSEHPESAAIDRVVAYLEASKLPYRTLRDGQALVVRDGQVRLVGQGT
jgi:dipeptidase E